MKLVMFDIDGTLILSTKIDKLCFLDAVREVFGIDTRECDWSSFSHVTDPGLAMEISEKFLKRKASGQDLSSIEQLFLKKLTLAAQEKPEEFLPVPGVHGIITRLLQPNTFPCAHPGPHRDIMRGDVQKNFRTKSRFAVAVATGGWESCAEIKLRAAGIRLKKIPMATADDSYKREEIMRRALILAQKKYGINSFDSVTYVGDAVWDVKASRSLGFQFIGIARGWKADKLSGEGAAHILPDFCDHEKFFRFLD